MWLLTLNDIKPYEGKRSNRNQLYGPNEDVYSFFEQLIVAYLQYVFELLRKTKIQLDNVNKQNLASRLNYTLLFCYKCPAHRKGIGHHLF